MVTNGGGFLATRAVTLRVLAKPRHADRRRGATVFYDSATLTLRMGDLRAEPALRRLLHAHHVSAITEITHASGLDLDVGALGGDVFTEARGYQGPGEGIGEGIFAMGAYGSLGEPKASSLRIVQDPGFRHLDEHGLVDRADVFVYAVDEHCASPRAAEWRALLAGTSLAGRLRVGVTCGDDPVTQSADLVMQTSSDYLPARARVARAAGKPGVWVYNGQRPYSGPMMLDVPATDLRANGWIAARYGIERWFYWESASIGWTMALEGKERGAGSTPSPSPETLPQRPRRLGQWRRYCRLPRNAAGERNRRTMAWPRCSRRFA